MSVHRAGSGQVMMVSSDDEWKMEKEARLRARAGRRQRLSANPRRAAPTPKPARPHAPGPGLSQAPVSSHSHRVPRRVRCAQPPKRGRDALRIAAALAASLSLSFSSLTSRPHVDRVRGQAVDEQGARVLLGDDDQAGGVGLLGREERGEAERVREERQRRWETREARTAPPRVARTRDRQVGRGPGSIQAGRWGQAQAAWPRMGALSACRARVPALLDPASRSSRSLGRGTAASATADAHPRRTSTSSCPLPSYLQELDGHAAGPFIVPRPGLFVEAIHFHPLEHGGGHGGRWEWWRWVWVRGGRRGGRAGLGAGGAAGFS